MAVNSNPRSEYRAGDSGYGLAAVGAGSDTVSLTPAARGILVTTGGNFDLICYDPLTGADVTVPFRTVAANTIWPFTVKRVNATNLTATLYYIW